MVLPLEYYKHIFKSQVKKEIAIEEFSDSGICCSWG